MLRCRSRVRAHLVLRRPRNLVEERLVQRPGNLLGHAHEPLAQDEPDVRGGERLRVGGRGRPGDGADGSAIRAADRRARRQGGPRAYAFHVREQRAVRRARGPPLQRRRYLRHPGDAPLELLGHVEDRYEAQHVLLRARLHDGAHPRLRPRASVRGRASAAASASASASARRRRAAPAAGDAPAGSPRPRASRRRSRRPSSSAGASWATARAARVDGRASAALLVRTVHPSSSPLGRRPMRRGRRGAARTVRASAAPARRRGARNAAVGWSGQWRRRERTSSPRSPSPEDRRTRCRA